MISGMGLLDRTYDSRCGKTACIALPAWGPVSPCSVALGGWWVWVVFLLGGWFLPEKKLLFLFQHGKRCASKFCEGSTDLELQIIDMEFLGANSVFEKV